MRAEKKVSEMKDFKTKQKMGKDKRVKQGNAAKLDNIAKHGQQE